jgi:uncharacterized protein (UPF0332 family)
LAEEFLQDAKTNLENKSLRTSISRSYYSVYHACVALFEHYGYRAHNFFSRSGRPAKKWEHGIIAKRSYSELVVRHKILDAQDVRFAHRRLRLTVWWINWLYRDRINADYRYDVSITERMAKKSLKRACAVYKNIKEAMK